MFLKEHHTKRSTIPISAAKAEFINIGGTLKSKVVSEDTVFEISHCFKVTVSRDEYFFEGLNILISTFCVCADGFQSLSNSFSLPDTIINFLFASLKLLTNFDNAYCEVKPPQSSFLCDWSMFFSADLSWLKENAKEVTFNRRLSGMISQNHRRTCCMHFQCQIAALGSLKQITMIEDRHRIPSNHTLRKLTNRICWHHKRFQLICG